MEVTYVCCGYSMLDNRQLGSQIIVRIRICVVIGAGRFF
jgi:hypothetical protein